jgi:hypothetical protein
VSSGIGGGTESVLILLTEKWTGAIFGARFKLFGFSARLWHDLKPRGDRTFIGDDSGMICI